MRMLRGVINQLHPGRRRRRYYLVELLRAYARDGVDPQLWPGACGVERPTFDRWLQDHGAIPIWIRTIATLAYHVPAPSRSYLYVPLTAALTVAALAVALVFIALH